MVTTSRTRYYIIIITIWCQTDFQSKGGIGTLTVSVDSEPDSEGEVSAVVAVMSASLADTLAEAMRSEASVIFFVADALQYSLSFVQKASARAVPPSETALASR
jgi:hypothetical protein